MITRRDFLKRLSLAIGLAATGDITKTVIEPAPEKLDISSVLARPGKESEKVDFDPYSATGLKTIDVQVDFGALPSEGLELEVYMAPDGVADKKNWNFVGMMRSDGDTKMCGSWMVHNPTGSHGVVVVGAPLAIIDIDVNPVEFEIS